MIRPPRADNLLAERCAVRGRDNCPRREGQRRAKLAYLYYEEEPGGFNTTAMSRRRFCSGWEVVELEVEGSGGITTAPAVQGSPLIELLPIVGAKIVVGSAGEIGTSGLLVTVFPLAIGLVVFPLRSGLLVFCASAVAVRPKTLRPISATRFIAMSDLPVAVPAPMRYYCFSRCP